MRSPGIHVATEVSGKVITASFRCGRRCAPELVALAEAVPAEPRHAARACRFALPAGAVWYRTLRVPAGEARGRRRIVAFEVERAFPLSGPDLIWDACRAPGADAEGAELVVGIRADDVAERIARLRGAGIRPVTMEPPGGPLYRYLRYREPQERRPGVLIDLLGSTAHVMLIVGCRWTLRTVSDAPQVAGPSRLERLHLEIARLLSGLGRGAAPAWVRVCGEANGGEALCRELELRLAIPVRMLDPVPARCMGREQGRPRPLADDLACALPVLIGLALAPETGECALDLLPPAIRRHEARRRRQPALIAASAVMAISLGALAVRAGQRAGDSHERSARLQQELPSLLKERRHLDENLEHVREQEERIGHAARLVHERDTWIRFLADLQTAVDAAGEAWIDRLERETVSAETTTQQVVVSGRLLDPGATGGRVSEAARRRVQALLAALGAASSVRRIGRERFTSGEPGVLQFELVVVLAWDEEEIRRR